MYDPRRADDRSIEEKALGLIYAMNDDQAQALRQKLAEMSVPNTAGGKRAKMFCGAFA